MKYRCTQLMSAMTASMTSACAAVSLPNSTRIFRLPQYDCTRMMLLPSMVPGTLLLIISCMASLKDGSGESREPSRAAQSPTLGILSRYSSAAGWGVDAGQMDHQSVKQCGGTCWMIY